ncbi:DUF4974 domain-containing protein [Prolixibacteraceae bacterium JC049]|nr:DUF4974 domain-containing protein [Prolixibacteraceae bacterium JC049]
MQKRIIKYLEGTINTDELKELENWLESSDNNRQLFNDFQDIWTAMQAHSVVNESLLQNEWERLEQSFNKGIEEKTVELTPPQSDNIDWKKWLNIAAIFIAGVLISSVFYFGEIGLGKNELTSTTIEMPKGAQSKMTLPDGSVVWINAGTKLSYDKAFGIKNRRLHLDGEAFFEVAKDASKAFLVATKEVTVKAYGTAFNVKDYSSDNFVETTLVEGKISVAKNSSPWNSSKNEVFLNDNEQIRFDKESRRNSNVLKGVDTGKVIGWTTGKLIIKREILKDLIPVLERRFNVNVHVMDEALYQIKFTGTIENETIEQLLEAVAVSANMKFEIKQRDIYLYNN